MQATASGFTRNTLGTIGANANAEGLFTHPPNSETIAETFSYLGDAILTEPRPPQGIKISLVRSTVSIEGSMVIDGDARVEVGAAFRITDVTGDKFTIANTWVYFQDTSLMGANKLQLTLDCPMFFNLDDPKDFVVEEFLYVRSQVGVEGGTGSALAAFGDTMEISNFQYFDQDGNLIPDVQVTGSNGNPYPYNAASVPEPSAALLATTALGLLSLARRRRRPL